MQLKSLTRQTDLIFSEFEGKIIKRDDYWVIKTPNNPDFYWGNYIIFKNPPSTADFYLWQEIFALEFDYYSEIKHMVFAWDLANHNHTAEVNLFIENGFNFDTTIALSTNTLNPPPRINQEIVIKEFLHETQWLEWLDQRLKSRDPQYPKEGFERFLIGQKKKYQSMSDCGLGNWYGAYIDEHLVASLGIFQKNGLARYQSVETMLERRRQGICGTLVYEASNRFKEKFDIHTFVMEADPEYHAAKIYESVGFRKTEQVYSLSWWSKD